MKDAPPKAVYLKDYQAPSHLINTIDLCFELDEKETIVHSKMQVRQNLSEDAAAGPLVLNGEKLELISVKIDGEELPSNRYTLTSTTLTLDITTEAFCLEIINKINPEANTALDGLYKSGEMICSQNEPQGFRKITYFIDRSDVMSKYTTKIIADKKKYPILLSNGNDVDRGELSDGRHWVTWVDPFVKPCYLYALVAGDLGLIKDTFTTCSGREIDLRIYCDKGNEGKCYHAMESLKKSMKWDEEVFGLEYDLDIFMIVAVDAFNFGAMENKGLNIFNTSCALADSKTATDDNFDRVEGVIAHEYFHNWTGNRVTCRDWFQLTLKEGLTVFRDQEFSSDMNSRPVKRIEDVLALRSRQFAEDSGPTSHPIKPSSYIQINNFYTSTIYNKGSEVIRMIHTLIGKKAFRKGIDLYFDLFDGQAVTTEDFIHAMHLASGRDFTQFTRWYHQAGTPRLKVTDHYDPSTKEYTLTCEQSCAPTADESPKEPFHIPLVIGLLDSKGTDLLNSEDSLLEMTKSQETFTFKGIEEKPIPSLNRGFSAPIHVDYAYSDEDYIFLMGHDSDNFNRWEAGQNFSTTLLLNFVEKIKKGEPLEVPELFFGSIEKILNDVDLSNALKAKALALPTESTVGQLQKVIDFDEIHQAREYLVAEIGKRFEEQFKKLHKELETTGDYSFDPVSVGKRKLKNLSLSYLVKSGCEGAAKLGFTQFKGANNMTDQFAALSCLSAVDCPERKEALSLFYDQWTDEILVINKWFALQSISKLPGALETVKTLLKDPLFDMKLPNSIRAILESFCENHIHFHNRDGSGYKFMADQVIDLDGRNPQVAARLSGAFRKFKKLDPSRKSLLEAELHRILAQPNLSNNVYEIVSKCLKDD